MILKYPIKDNTNYNFSEIKRIKTFDDALNKLGNKHPFVKEYKAIKDFVTEDDLMAYLKLRIITAALNGNWKPSLKRRQLHYYLWITIYTKEQYNELPEDKKERCYFYSGLHVYAAISSVMWDTNRELTFATSEYGAQLVFKSRELAEYAAEQFIDLWLKFLFKVL